jgi:hypothetical protein
MRLGPGTRIWVGGIGALAAVAMLVLGATGASGAHSKVDVTLTVQVVPGIVSAGEPALAIASFSNLSPVTMQSVAVTLRFPPNLTVVQSPGCKPTHSTGVIVCGFGDVEKGHSARAAVSARVSSHLQENSKISVKFSLRVGLGHPAPILTGASAKVLASNDAAHRGACLPKPRTLTATFESQLTSIPSPPTVDPTLRLPCTPLSVGVLPTPDFPGLITKVASLDLPRLKQAAIVKLTFPDKTLPDENLISNLPAGAHPSFRNPNPLWKINPVTGVRTVVPKCRPGPAFPAGWHACIVKVTAEGLDPLHDYDAGTITLLVQGTGFGDPRFVG